MAILKRLRSIHLFAIIAVLSLAACQSDSIEEQSGAQRRSDMARVTLHIATDDANSQKANTRVWEDPNAKAQPDRTEMMYSWHVLLVDASNKVVFKKSNTAVADANAEIDIVAENVDLAVGTYTAYSFANIPLSSLPTAINKEVGDDFTSADATALANATYSVSGNGFVPSETNGIPMSNKQTITIAAGDTEKDFIVIRMLAKMEVSIKNETGKEAKVQSITFSDITTNTADNLMLLPKLTDEANANTMEAVHGDIQPNLNTTATVADFTVDVNKTIANDATETVTFYINESAKPTNPDGLFYLSVKMNDTDFRYAMINSQNTDKTKPNYMWDYIARNDYRIIPIVLDDYKLELIPYDFPAIGVYPASVREIESDLYEMTFHDYGHFHLVPKMTKISTGDVVGYSASNPSGTTWTLDTETGFAGSWKTAATEGGEWVANGNPNNFYRPDTDPSNPIIATTADGDEVGGVPVWYANTSSPQWDPAGGTNYVPFIFGYIADPGGTMSEDKKIYHEFRVKLYVGGTYRRDILYRFYMVLSKDQMSYARRMNVCSPLSHASKHN